MPAVAPFIFMIFFLVYLGIHFYRKDMEIARREKLVRRMLPVTGNRIGEYRLHLRKRSIRGENLISAFIDVGRVVELIAKSGSRLSVEKFFLILTICALAGMITGILVFGEFVPGLSLAIGGMFLPVMVLRRKRARREMLFAEQFPEAIDFVVRSLKAGQSVDHAFGGVSSHFPEPAGAEFRLVYEEIALGLPFGEAIAHFARRFPNMADVRFFCTALIIQRETGGNLTSILDNLSRTIRTRFRFDGHVKSLTAEGRLSGLMLALLPAGYAGLNYLLNREYMESFFTDPSLKRLLFMAIALDIAGMAVMRMLSKVDV